MLTIPLRQAVIYSDFQTRVKVTALGSPEPAHLNWSFGASCEDWGEASAEALHLGLYRGFAELVEHARIPSAHVHRAFCVIPEYRAGLSPDHPDAMPWTELCRLSIMMDLPRSSFPTSLFSV
jgi:hypothetical protein